jgi:hypothetical protein
MAQKWPEMAKNVYICDKRSPKRPKIAKYTQIPKLTNIYLLDFFRQSDPLCSDATLTLLWRYAGTTLTLLWRYSDATLTLLWRYSDATLTLLWRYSDTTSSGLWRYFCIFSMTPKPGGVILKLVNNWFVCFEEKNSLVKNCHWQQWENDCVGRHYGWMVEDDVVLPCETLAASLVIFVAQTIRDDGGKPGPTSYWPPVRYVPSPPWSSTWLSDRNRVWLWQEKTNT